MWDKWNNFYWCQFEIHKYLEKNVQFMQNAINNKVLYYHWYKISSLLTYAVIEKADFLITKIGQIVIMFFFLHTFSNKWKVGICIYVHIYNYQMNYYEVLINWSNNYGALFDYHVYFYKKNRNSKTFQKLALMVFYTRLLSNFCDHTKFSRTFLQPFLHWLTDT